MKAGEAGQIRRSGVLVAGDDADGRHDGVLGVLIFRRVLDRHVDEARLPETDDEDRRHRSDDEHREPEDGCETHALFALEDTQGVLLSGVMRGWRSR
ncbi:MAG: hypothetical protein MZW92_12485 [Comamonadaceae bacterium]|nr:hypothetical protein [Comamonadaceae bacterium]